MGPAPASPVPSPTGLTVLFRHSADRDRLATHTSSAAEFRGKKQTSRSDVAAAASPLVRLGSATSNWTVLGPRVSLLDRHPKLIGLGTHDVRLPGRCPDSILCARKFGAKFLL